MNGPVTDLRCRDGRETASERYGYVAIGGAATGTVSVPGGLSRAPRRGLSAAG